MAKQRWKAVKLKQKFDRQRFKNFTGKYSEDDMFISKVISIISCCIYKYKFRVAVKKKSTPQRRGPTQAFLLQFFK